MPARTTGLMPVRPLGAMLARRREPVAAAAHRLDEAVLAERLERLPQAPDVDVDRALLDVHVVAPHVVQQLRPRMDALRAARAGSAAAGIRSGPRGTVLSSTVTRCVAGSSVSAPAASGSCAASGARRRSTALIRAFNSRGENGFVT